MKRSEPKILPVEGNEPKIPYSLSESPRSFLIIFEEDETTPLSPLIIIDRATKVRKTMSLNTLERVNFASDFGVSESNLSAY